MKIEFEIDDELMPLSGVAVIHCLNSEGHPMIAHAEYGEIRTVETIGLLTTALDQARYHFLDTDHKDFP